ncbi:hypothetical protein [Photobacterium damselae]|uniref:hypothetical protein n=1 Tax=Photobacterium damselae TaxID=38293 RepID=UPI0040690C93
MPNTDGVVGVVTQVIGRDLFVSLCKANPDIDKVSDDTIKTIHKRQDIQFKLNVDDFAAAKGDHSGFYRNLGLENTPDSLGVFLHDIKAFLSSECIRAGEKGGKPQLSMKTLCKGIIENNFAGVTVISCPLFDESLRDNAVKANNRYVGVVSRKAEKSKFLSSNKKQYELDSITLTPYSTNSKKAISRLSNLTTISASFKDTDHTKNIIVGINPSVYGRGERQNVYVDMFYSGESPIANIKVSVNARENKLNSDELDTIWAGICSKLVENLKSSLVSDYINILEDGGLIDQLKNTFGENAITVKAKPKRLLPVSYLIEHFSEMGYMPQYRMENDKVNEHGQEIYKLADGSEILTTGLAALAENSWSEHSPERWLARNRTGRGLSKDFVKYLMTREVAGGGKLLTHPNAVAGYEQNAKKLDESAEAIIAVTRKYMVDNNVEFTNLGSRVKTMVMRPRMPAHYYNPADGDDVDIRGYFTSRGISNSVVDMAAKSRMVFMGSVSPNQQGAFFDCGTFGYSKENSRSVQLFEMAEDGKIDKQFLSKGLVSGSAHELGGNAPKYIAVGEAIVDMYSLMTLVEAGGFNKEDFKVCSLNSANNTHAWFKESFKVCPPDDDGHGFLVNTVYKPVSDFNFVDYFKNSLTFYSRNNKSFSTYSKVQFIHDGTQESDDALLRLSKILELADMSSTLNVVHDAERKCLNRVEFSTLLFDKTNVKQTLESNGISFNPSTGKFSKYDVVEELVPIKSEDERLVARKRIIEKIGSAKFLLAMDNDEAGVSKAIDMHNLLTYLDIPVSVVMIPFESKYSDRYKNDDVVPLVTSLYGSEFGDSPMLPYGERTLLNDVNDALVKYNHLVETSPEDSKIFMERIISQFNDDSYTNSRKLLNADKVSGYFKQVVVGIRQKYPEIMALGKQLGAIEYEKRKHLRHKDTQAAEREHKNLARVYREIEGLMSAVPKEDILHVENDRNLKTYLNISTSIKKRSVPKPPAP